MIAVVVISGGYLLAVSSSSSNLLNLSRLVVEAHRQTDSQSGSLVASKGGSFPLAPLRL